MDRDSYTYQDYTEDQILSEEQEIEKSLEVIFSQEDFDKSKE